ncbi:MAG: hypothetical protein QXV22_03115, partial [Thermoplasmataceae archaeon]
TAPIDTMAYGLLDESGMLKIQEFHPQMIFPDGHAAFSQDIEAIVSKVPNIKEAAAIQRRRKDGTEEIVLFVVQKAAKQLNEANFKKDLAKYLPSHLIPKRVFVREELPKTMNGKVLKTVLLDEIKAS